MTDRTVSEEDLEVNAAPKWIRWAGVAILMIHAALLAWAATRHSPNANEPAHLVAGISHWEFGRFELYRVNPPLVRMVAALPVLAAGADTDWSSFQEAPGARPVFGIGEKFIKANGYRAFWLMTLARWACIPFSLAGGYVCYRWSRELYGNLSGLLALTLWCFSPNILAHAEFITPDAGATAMGLAAMYLFWRWLKQPDWLPAIGAGVLLGLAQLTKSTWILLFALWPVLWLVWRVMELHADGRPSFLRRVGQMVLILVLGLHVLNLGYGYDGSLRKLESFQFVSQTLGGPKENPDSPRVDNRFVGTWLGKLPVPLPAQYLLGIDVQKHDFERDRRSYLRGQWYDHGFWYYYLYALAIKVPVGTWLLALLALLLTVFRCSRRVRWRDAFVLLAPALLVLTFVSAETEYNAHLRYVLLIFPFGFIWISQVARLVATNRRTLQAFAITALLWSLGSSLWHYPHTLAYFNELVGGPKNGHSHLIYSNLDWGQDLLFFKEWLDEHPEAKPIHLAYFGLFDPSVTGIQYQLAPKLEKPSKQETSVPQSSDYDGPQPGWHAVSVNFLRGFDHWTYNGAGERVSVDVDDYSYFLRMKPVAMAGYSIDIYHVTRNDANRLRRELGLPELPSADKMPPG